MGNACSIAEHRKKTASGALLDGYTDELAEKFAAEVGASPRPMETKNEIDERGAFVRQPNAFIGKAGEGEGEWKPEAGRYQIYWMKGCNWSNRPVIVRDILGLTDVIYDIRTSHSGQTNKYGHGFGEQDGFKDPRTGAYFLSEFYKNANPNFKGRATTPTIVDIKEKKAVNNDYHRMTNYLEVNFRAFQPEDAPDLYPVKYRDVIDEFNDWLFPHINNGHYRMAFCQSLEAYNEAFEDFYSSMDKLEKRLSENRFLFGDYITDSDIRFFVTIVRWDTSYFRNVGPIRRRIADYPNIYAYMKELYNIPAFKNATFVHDLVLGKSESDPDKDLFADWNTRIASQINYDELWADDGKRAKLSSDPTGDIYLRHPKGETVEEYQSEISVSHWNSSKQADRDPSNPNNSILRVDASVNPLKGLLKNN
ncbi:glutathione S-transferase C-terminal domain-containing protein [Butyrivibrio sp. AE3004]|uniref:glutathione S-transferase C-terminal domain-containing protein n=1 Tax=Butyrivibrio sp. AE3004 TaxID=1506994 RepID=UPI0009E04DFC|nr:glutathione S-transferase C-terminal domain-containing protein [Butyrivibrio sp. AE3004]